MTPRRSSELDVTPPLPLRAPTPPGHSLTGAGHNKRKKSREEKDSFFSSFFFGSSSRPSSPSHESGPQSMNNLPGRSKGKAGHTRKLSAGNLKAGLTIPGEDEPRRKSFDYIQPYFPPPEIAPFMYQINQHEENEKSSTMSMFSNSDSYSSKHRRTGSADSDSFSSKDKEPPTPEGISRKNSNTESHPNLLITSYDQRDDHLPSKNDHYHWGMKLKKEHKSGKKQKSNKLEDMKDIIKTENNRHSGVPSFKSFDDLWQENPTTERSQFPPKRAEHWTAPESWAVNLHPNHEIPIEKDEKDEKDVRDSLRLFCIRIFRPDATFGTVNCGLNTTTSELCQILGKKFFIQDISKYNIYVMRHNLERVLGSHERPLQLQKKWLEQAGYTVKDNLEDLGREDNSYLVRFTFRETTVPRFEEEGNLSNFQKVDLQSRNLQTIPIFLYRQAFNIRSLNVSHNLMLDLPTDFIQSCAQLRELNLSQNDLERVPQSIKQSEMLSFLNLNSNRLKDLEHGSLEMIRELTNLQVENNLLEILPKKLPKLSIMNVANNLFKEFPQVICNIVTLSELDLSYNEITSIPEEIGKLVHLKKLFLIGNLIDKLPESFQNLTSLQELDIRRNKITNLNTISLIPNLEIFLTEFNNLSTVDISSKSLQKLILSKNQLTQFSLKETGSSLKELSLANAKLVALPNELFEHLESVQKLNIRNNQLTSIPTTIGMLKNLTHLTCVYNTLRTLPSEISCLDSLHALDIHFNNLVSLPQEIWLCKSLTVLNVSSNLLEQFPAPPTNLSTENSLISSLRALYLGDNSISAEIFPYIALFSKLEILNISFNLLDQIPPGGISNPYLTELYLSGNHLSSLPEDIDKLTNLSVLHVNGNRLTTLPAELSKIRKLVVLDVGNNYLKYNIANWQYDWNWNWNIELKYLNLSGNKRFEIKHVHQNEINPLRDRNLADFRMLTELRVLGLMDITLLNFSVPEETDNRRVRTSVSLVNSMRYGMADTLGKSDNLSTWEAVTPKFRDREDECIFGLFDARAGSIQGGRVTKYLHDWFAFHFKTELDRLKVNDSESVESALRRSFLSLNKELGSKVFNSSIETDFYSRDTESGYHQHSSLGIDDNKSGASGLVAYISGTTLYIANVGDTVAVISRGKGAYPVARCPEVFSEIKRIREAGGYISHDCLVNGELDVSRSFGHFHLTPIINANPITKVVQLSEQDELLILATRELWNYISYQLAVDIARTEKSNLMLAAQKLRDFAISYGADKNIMVMIIGVGDLFDRRYSMIRERKGDEVGQIKIFGSGSRRRRDEIPSDNTMARLEKEISPPKGQVALVFTDIKNSTFLWETRPNAMRSAIKSHNDVMRRLLRNIGGYEVKTEGDAFMVSFPTVASALLWCLTVQIELLDVNWPKEIIDSEDGKEVYWPQDIIDSEDGKKVSGHDKELIYKGLSVRMGIHWGSPDHEEDIITKRMDYFGPVVNRAARICSVADGGQICVSSEVESKISGYKYVGEQDPGRKDSIGGDDEVQESSNDMLDKNAIALKKMKFVIKPIGEKKLKGLENAEKLSLVYPVKLKGRLEKDHMKTRNSIKVPEKYEPIATTQLVDPSCVRTLGYLCLRLERVVSGNVNHRTFRSSRIDPMTRLLTLHVKDNADDEELMKIMESLITRIENAISTLYLNKFGKFTRVLEELGDALALDPDHIVRALQMYAQDVIDRTGMEMYSLCDNLNEKKLLWKYWTVLAIEIEKQ
ncbi:1269_t:CDS:10 [Gigaspora margarita]|uniref:Adenylate cyclase n=1 Tax=Gigaspora margarita TaxID=4874 RepID=A0ABN7UCK2_GIGMA|nr:1269_t:CDS:10 [Gigaspora margarita]